jgi:RNA polymerase sigma-70 factor (ECF subfamily)
MQATASLPEDQGQNEPRGQIGRDRGAAGTEFTTALVALHGELHHRAMFLTHDMTAADDLVQDALERALAARAQFRPGTNLRAWVGSIMRNLFVDACRRRPLVEQPADELAWTPPESFDGPLEVLSLNDVQTALSGMKAQDREILTLACLERRSYRDISEHLGIPVQTVGTRLFRARAKLRMQLQSVYEDRMEKGGDDRFGRAGQGVVVSFPLPGTRSARSTDDDVRGTA